jgi:hypothetical protein
MALLEPGLAVVDDGPAFGIARAISSVTYSPLLSDTTELNDMSACLPQPTTFDPETGTSFEHRTRS